MQRDFHLPGRSAAVGANGMAATSHPLATLAAIDVLRSGGNAMDAAIAANAVQCVVEPQSTGIGGDCWILYCKGGEGHVHAMNSSGWAPAAADPALLRDQGMSAIERTSAHAVTVPGAPAGWQSALDHFGTISLEALLQPAIAHAEEGYVVAPRVALDWRANAETLALHEGGRKFFLLDGEAPAAGQVMRHPALARTFRTVGARGVEAFYRGDLAQAMLATLKATGGVHEAEDFATFEPEWAEPVSTPYRDIEVFECPPNGQGIIALLLLNMLEGFDLAALDPHGADRFHIEAEATRLAYRDRDLRLADPRLADVPVQEWLDKGYARRLAGSINIWRAMPDLPPPLLPAHPDTITLTVVDKDLNCVSFINSLYDGFGSGIVCPTTGVNFHSRGRAFSLQAGHPNELAAHKRPRHTIIPGMAMKKGRPWLGFGVMGGEYQATGHAHLLTNIVDFGMDPQAAISSPRAFAYPDGLQAERGISDAVVRDLAERGHRIEAADAPLGGGQAVMIDHERGIMIGGTEHRKDGLALGY